MRGAKGEHIAAQGETSPSQGDKMDQEQNLNQKQRMLELECEIRKLYRVIASYRLTNMRQSHELSERNIRQQLDDSRIRQLESTNRQLQEEMMVLRAENDNLRRIIDNFRQGQLPYIIAQQTYPSILEISPCTSVSNIDIWGHKIKF